MHANHIDALWDFLTTGRRRSLIVPFRAAPHDEALAVLDIIEVGPSSPSSTARYFTVKLHREGRTSVRHLEAKNDLHANQLVLACNPSATCVEFVREIDRAEFERLTK